MVIASLIGGSLLFGCVVGFSFLLVHCISKTEEDVKAGEEVYGKHEQF